MQWFIEKNEDRVLRLSRNVGIFGYSSFNTSSRRLSCWYFKYAKGHLCPPPWMLILLLYPEPRVHYSLFQCLLKLSRIMKLPWQSAGLGFCICLIQDSSSIAESAFIPTWQLKGELKNLKLLQLCVRNAVLSRCYVTDATRSVLETPPERGSPAPLQLQDRSAAPQPGLQRVVKAAAEGTERAMRDLSVWLPFPQLVATSVFWGVARVTAPQGGQGSTCVDAGSKNAGALGPAGYIKSSKAKGL